MIWKILLIIIVMHGNGHSYSYKLKELQLFLAPWIVTCLILLVSGDFFFYRETEWEALVDWQNKKFRTPLYETNYNI